MTERSADGEFARPVRTLTATSLRYEFETGEGRHADDPASGTAGAPPGQILGLIRQGTGGQEVRKQT
jgi:hypothetical protein